MNELTLFGCTGRSGLALLQSKLDRHGEIFSLPEPDLDALERFMWTNDAPFVGR
jgi:hypothetical protein